MSDTSVEDASRPSRRLLLSSLAAWIILALLLPLAALTLNIVTVADFKLGYWVTAQGALIGLAALSWLFAHRAGGARSGAGILPAATAAGEATGAAVIIGFAGAIASLGFGGLSLPLGLVAGLSFMTIAIAPRFVLYPVRSIGGFFVLRFGGVWPRRIALLIAGVVAVLLIAATLRAGALALQGALELDYAQAAGAMTLAIAAAWIGASVTQLHSRRGLIFGVLLFAVVISVSALAASNGRSPADLIAHGGAIAGLAALEQKLIAENLATFEALRPLASPFLQLSMTNFAGLVLATALGVAGLPHLLGRHASHRAVPTGAAARRFAYATILTAILVIGLAVFAVHSRLALAGMLAGGLETAAPPASLATMLKLGWTEVCGATNATELASACASDPENRGFIRMQDVAFASDAQGIAALHVSATSPLIQIAIFAALIVAAIAVGAAVLSSWLDADGEARSRGGVEPGALDARTLVLGACLLGVSAVIAIVARPGVATAFVDALTLVAASLTPILALSLYWRRMTAAGAAVAMVIGFSVAAGYIVGVRLAPAEMFAWTGAFSDASPAAVEMFETLRAQLAGPLTPEARAAATNDLAEISAAVANWGGLRPPAIVIFAAPLALIAAVLVSLAGRTPSAAANEPSQ